MTAFDEGVPVYSCLDGQIWLIGAEPVRWFERVLWWETKTWMSNRDGNSRIDVEVWQLQAHPAAGDPTDPTTFDVWAAAVISDSGISGFLYAARAGC